MASDWNANRGITLFNQFLNSYGTVSDADKESIRALQPHDINNNGTTHTAQVTCEKVLQYGGASLSRDAVDERIVENVKNKPYDFEGSNGSTNGIIDSQTDVGSWPELNSTNPPVDTSNDGMPDGWKLSRKLAPEKFQANGNDLSTGYDNLEVYINSLVKNITEKQN